MWNCDLGLLNATHVFFVHTCVIYWCRECFPYCFSNASSVAYNGKLCCEISVMIGKKAALLWFRSPLWKHWHAYCPLCRVKGILPDGQRKKGIRLCEIETDKATLEFESLEEGYVLGNLSKCRFSFWYVTHEQFLLNT